METKGLVAFWARSAHTAAGFVTSSAARAAAAAVSSNGNNPTRRASCTRCGPSPRRGLSRCLSSSARQGASVHRYARLYIARCRWYLFTAELRSVTRRPYQLHYGHPSRMTEPILQAWANSLAASSAPDPKRVRPHDALQVDTVLYMWSYPHTRLLLCCTASSLLRGVQDHGS